MDILYFQFNCVSSTSFCAEKRSASVIWDQKTATRHKSYVAFTFLAGESLNIEKLKSCEGEYSGFLRSAWFVLFCLVSDKMRITASAPLRIVWGIDNQLHGKTHVFRWSFPVNWWFISYPFFVNSPTSFPSRNIGCCSLDNVLGFKFLFWSSVRDATW